MTQFNEKLLIINYLANLQNGDIVRHLQQRLNVTSIKFAFIIFSAEPYFASFKIGNINVTRGTRSWTGGLKHTGSQSSAIGDLVKLLGPEVVGEDMERENISESIDGVLFWKKWRHGGIVKSEDCDGLTAVNFGGQVGNGEVVIEGWELRVFGEYASDVVGVGDGREEEESEKEREDGGGDEYCPLCHDGDGGGGGDGEWKSEVGLCLCL